MAKIRLTKTELKKKKDELAAFNRYLPTLNIKKKLLQKEHLKTDAEVEKLRLSKKKSLQKAQSWLALLGGDFDCFSLVKIKKIKIESDYLAGIAIPILKEVEMVDQNYDLFQTPFWVDQVLVFVREYLTEEVKKLTLEKKKQLILDELVITTQRINLFEKIKIPEAQRAIAKIRNHLDDEQAIAMGWALAAKKKLAAQAEGTI
ncbi:MAG: V-type ATP synthase subunit D [SAR324 cluster bacterium]|nr:V-type ATP synthase subunit D [SAR324 cluster bacterium]